MAWRYRAAIIAVLGVWSMAAVAREPAAEFAPAFAPAFATPAPDEPFRLSVQRPASGGLQLTWGIEPGTYLYRDSLKATRDGVPLSLDLPPGGAKDDPNFGRVEIYHDRVEARLADPASTGRLDVAFQGCSEQGICYPPQRRAVDLATLSVRPVSRALIPDAPAASAPARAGIASEAAAAPEISTASGPRSGPGAGADGSDALFRGSSGWTVLAFFGFGLLLAVTPCVFPMIPILAGMLAGSGEGLTRRRGIALSGAYVLAMAGAYGLVGAVAGWSGANLQVVLQTPLALGVTAAIFVALALSMFGLFDLAVPAALSARFAGRKGAGGSLAGAALLGFGSALIVGPCVTPPLAGAMLYAASTGDAATGAAALFMLGLGMGLPLMLVGVFGPALLPRSGPWLLRARQLFGVVFLAVAALLAGRLLPPPATLALLGILAVGSSVFFGGFDRLTETSTGAARLARGAGMIVAIYGATLIVGAAGGAGDPLRPLAFGGVPAAGPVAPERGVRVSSMADFQRAVATERGNGRPIFVAFTADWCTTCKSNEAVLASPALRARLARLPTITADVTEYGSPTQQLMHRFAVAGPPTMFLLDTQGREVPGSRLVGPITADDITRRLDAAGG